MSVFQFLSVYFGLFLLLLFGICYINGNNKKSTLNLFFGFFIIFVILNVRLLERLPNKLDFDSMYLLLLALFIFSTNCFILFRNIIFPKIQKNDRILKCIYWIYDIIYFFQVSLFTTYVQLLQLFPSYKNIFFIICYNITKIEYKYFMEILLLVFDILPKLLLLGTFMVDVLIFQEFYYFYKVLWIILFPLLLKTIVFILDNYTLEEIEDLQRYFVIELSNVTLRNHLLIDYEGSYIEYRDSPYSLEEVNLIYITYTKIQFCTNHLFMLTDKLAVKYLMNFILTGYLIAWGYVIIKILLNYGIF